MSHVPPPPPGPKQPPVPARGPEGPSSHLTLAQAGRWTSGLLDDDEAAAIEAHVAACVACTRLLQDEARVELALSEACRLAPAPAAPSWWWRWALPLSAAAAIVALGLADLPSSARSATGDGGITSFAPGALSESVLPLRYEGANPRPVLPSPAPL